MQHWLSRFPLIAGRRAPARSQELLVVCHSDDPQGLEIMENICAGLDFARVRFSVLDMKRRMAWPDPAAFASIVVCTERLRELDADKAAALERYVTAGGGMLVACRAWSPDLSALFGFATNHEEPTTRPTSGLVFGREMLPGAAGLAITDADWLFEHDRFDVAERELSDDCRIFASDGDGRPVGWSRRHGRGTVTCWNTGILFCRVLRGFALQSVLGTMQVGVAAIAGFAMFHVDDFPPALSEARPDPLPDEFPGLDLSGFVFDVWHADMMALKARHGLRYTWYAVMDYGDIDTRAALAAPAARSGRTILEERFRRIAGQAGDDEFGFHGYNHEPLVAASWPDPATLRAKLGRARELWHQCVPAPMPTSWVPANNWYEPGHLGVMGEVFPEISTVCSLFSCGDPEMGEYREFGPEPWNGALTCLPRETYGYVLDPKNRMAMLSQVAGMGVWTHFVHPDDVFDRPASPGDARLHRNPESRMWRGSGPGGSPGLHSCLDRWLSEFRALFPWIEFLTTAQAAARCRARAGNRVDVAFGDDCVEIRCASESLFHVRTRADTRLVAAAGGAVLDRRELDDGVLHVVRCPAGRTTFRLRSA